MGKLSTFLIMLIVFMLVVVAGFGALMASINDNYDMSDYEENRTEVYNKLSEISDDTEGIKNQTKAMQSRSGVVDVLGGFIEASFLTIRTAFSGFSIFQLFADQAVEDVGITNADVFKSGLIMIGIIAVILGIIVSALLKKDI